MDKERIKFLQKHADNKKIAMILKNMGLTKDSTDAEIEQKLTKRKVVEVPHDEYIDLQGTHKSEYYFNISLTLSRTQLGYIESLYISNSTKEEILDIINNTEPEDLRDELSNIAQDLTETALSTCLDDAYEDARNDEDLPEGAIIDNVDLADSYTDDDFLYEMILDTIIEEYE